MDRFSELINKGVAAFHYTPICQSIPEQDPICRSYNNIFSIATDTHMSLLDDGTRVITGHMVGDAKKFDSFIWSCQYAGVNFHTAGVCSFSDWMHKFNLVGGYHIINGDSVYTCTVQKEEDESSTKTLASTPTISTTMTSFTTEASIIPQSTRFLTKDNQMDSIKECIKGTFEETAQAMNESRYVYGDNWIVTNLSDGVHIVGVINGKAYKI